MAMYLNINVINLYGEVFEKNIYNIFIVNIFRYFVFTVTFFIIFNTFLKNRKIQNELPTNKSIFIQVFYSILGLIVLSTATLISLKLNTSFKPKIYFTFSDHSIVYHCLVFLIFIVYQDIYFYIIHRLLHTDFLYKKIHYIHHQFTNPTTFTFLAQHPLDLLMQSVGNFLFIYLLPMHPVDLFINSFFLTMINIYGHSGFELYPSGFTKHWLAKYFTTSTNHNMHHSHNACNYGLWFTVCDRLFGTLHPEYDTYYEQIQDKIKNKTQPYAISESVNNLTAKQ